MWVLPNCVFIYIYLYMYMYISVYLFLYFWQDIDEVIKILSSSSLENTPVKEKEKSKLVRFGE